MKGRWCKLPIERSMRWDDLTLSQRCLGTELFRVFQERRVMVGANWAAAVCRAIAVEPEGRNNVCKSLYTMQKAGLIVVDDGWFQLLYTDAAIAAHERQPAPALPSVCPTSEAGLTPVCLVSDTSLPSVCPTSEAGLTSATTRNHSTPKNTERERERERETHTEGARGVDWQSVPDAGKIQSRFKALYLARFRAAPAMGGKSVHEFPERLLATAQAQGTEPLAMLEAAFERWKPAADDAIARNAPYAAFCGRFGSLVDPTEHRAAPSGRKALADAAAKALREHNVPEYERLNSALANFGKETA